ncbi:MAG: penicillin acylase family protein [Archangium sp.]
MTILTVDEGPDKVTPSWSATPYPLHLRAGSLDVAGSGFAGVPSVVLGHNRRIAWGATTNPLDVTDTYSEVVVSDSSSPSGLSTVYQGRQEHVLAIPETFRVNRRGTGTDDLVVVPPGEGVPAATLLVPRRNGGPILELDLAAGRALSVQYTGFSATRELDAFLRFDEARNLDDFRAALQSFDVGPQNFAYADIDGNIAYFTSAEMPLREDLEAGHIIGLPPAFIRNGTGGNEWLPVSTPLPGQAVPYEILPPEEMPHLLNPPAGWFVNANNDPIGTTLDDDPFNQLRPTGGIYYLDYGYRWTRQRTGCGQTRWTPSCSAAPRHTGSWPGR